MGKAMASTQTGFAVDLPLPRAEWTRSFCIAGYEAITKVLYLAKGRMRLRY